MNLSNPNTSVSKSLSQLRLDLDSTDRNLLTRIWAHYLAHNSWPTLRDFHSAETDDANVKRLEALGSFIITITPDPQSYRLSFLGVMLGKRIEQKDLESEWMVNEQEAFRLSRLVYLSGFCDCPNSRFSVKSWYIALPENILPLNYHQDFAPLVEALALWDISAKQKGDVNQSVDNFGRIMPPPITVSYDMARKDPTLQGKWIQYLDMHENQAKIEHIERATAHLKWMDKQKAQFIGMHHVTYSKLKPRSSKKNSHHSFRVASLFPIPTTGLSVLVLPNGGWRLFQHRGL